MSRRTSRPGLRRGRPGLPGLHPGRSGLPGLRRGRLGPAAASLTSAALAAALARAAYAALSRRPPGGAGTWTRTNHRGEPVTLLEGPALALAAIAAPALASGLSPRLRAALAVAGTGAAAFGGYDDLAGDGDRRGFRGHLGALAQGEVTTGAVKLGGIGGTGLVAAAVLGGAPADVAINAGLVAGGANLLNLFDLRPGRAIKVALAGGALLAAAAPAGHSTGTRQDNGPGAGLRPVDGQDAYPRQEPGQDAGTWQGAGQAVAAPLGAALALLGEDLGERAMLGDAGANALGALLGVVAAASLSRLARVALLAVIAGLTAASEKVSFTAVIERTPALRWLDMLGRRPVLAAPVPGRPATPLPTGAEEAGHTAAAPSP
jgi:UDP-GlcNAc:undecaprenyl-phosphate/decaprenyl-phosphate GlcNAc-1-phosphate transferase